MATGRVPKIQGLGLEDVGVKLGECRGAGEVAVLAVVSTWQHACGAVRATCKPRVVTATGNTSCFCLSTIPPFSPC